MQNQTDSPDKDTNSLSELAQSMFSNNNNNNSDTSSINNSTIMLSAIVSLLLVILFVLLLHVYAKWFLSQSHHNQQPPSQTRRRRRRRQRNPATVSGVTRPLQFHHFHIEESPFSTKGLDSATVSAIPLFVYKAGETEEFECVICLSGFEEAEIGRILPKCSHAFHVDCIDMWLSSHSNCPICRAQIACGAVLQNDSQLGSLDGDGVLEIVIDTPNYEISESELGNESGNDNFGGSVSETCSSLLLGCSLKRMLSKVFVSSNVNGFDGSQ